MRQTGHYIDSDKLTLSVLRKQLLIRIESLDIERAKEDVVRFLRQPEQVAGWSPQTFQLVAEKIKSRELQ